MSELALPDPLVFEDGRSVDAASWPARRAEMLALFEDHVYGRTPVGDVDATAEVVEEGDAPGGTARRRQVRLDLTRNGQALTIDVLLYLPPNGPAPVFVVANFDGNHTVQPDEAILLSTGVTRDRPDDVPERGAKERRFPIDTIVDRGYGLVTWYYGDADPDVDDGFANGAHPLFYSDGQTSPDPDQWGSVGAWAWGNSRVLDHLLADPDVDGERVIVGGHSRLGKAALWTAALDERFAMAFANDSGCTGAALSRRRFGENVAVINTLFPHWFCRNYRCYSNNEASLPVDQHQLVALVAPRPVHVASATADDWADPQGEFLGAHGADPVYRLLGTDGIAVDEQPPPDTASIGTISYHLRTGDHDLLEADWRHYLDSADQNLG
ncbi:MAG: acetylxylan esterase [Acidimicrobiia bacterium]|nr:acetylxylan esterase [Acidimicrobiia bacterium]